MELPIILADAVKKAGLWGKDQQLYFPLITKSGINNNGKMIHYYFNYSSSPATYTYPYKKGKELLSNEIMDTNKQVTLPAWGVNIVEED
jgi:beta-galactosidase